MNFTAQDDTHPMMHQRDNQHRADQRCGYPSKRCENRRVVKRDGGLHRFCEHHRLVANMNQQRLQQRKRMQQAAMHHPPRQTTALPVDDMLKYSQHVEASELQDFHQDTGFELPTVLTDEDLHLLEELLWEDEWSYDLVEKDVTPVTRW